MKVRELVGIQSFYAAVAFHKLMLGLKMLPAYFSFSYSEFYQYLDTLSLEEQEKYIREAVLFVRLDREEINDLAQFCEDANGVAYGPENMKRLKPEEIHELIVAVSIEISKAHKVRLVSESEKKNSTISQ